MDTHATALIVIIAIAVIAVVVVAIVIASKSPGRALDSGGEAGPRWYEILLAVGLLVLLAVAVVVLALSQHSGADSALTSADWRDESGSLTFLIMMVALAGAGVLAYVIFVITRLPKTASALPGATLGDELPEPHQESPAAVRLIGLLGLVVALLLLGWIYAPPAQLYGLMLQLVYPATFALALVLLFDKASRLWSIKTTAETVREWMLCDAIVFLLFIAFLNLLRFEPAGEYAGVFWDVLYLSGFLFTFWMLDRKLTRYRFLVAYGYLAVVPMLLLGWRWVQEVPVAEDLSWWSTVWPFFFLSLLFFVLEVIALIATRTQVVPAVKDGVFLLLYAIALMIAIPEPV